MPAETCRERSNVQTTRQAKYVAHRSSITAHGWPSPFAGYRDDEAAECLDGGDFVWPVFVPPRPRGMWKPDPLRTGHFSGCGTAVRLRFRPIWRGVFADGAGSDATARLSPLEGQRIDDKRTIGAWPSLARFVLL